MPDSKKLQASKYAATVEESVRACEALRRDTNAPVDISLGEFIQGKHNVTMEQYYEDLGLNPRVDTIQNIVNLPNNSLRWLIPEIYRDALRLGLRKNPIYPSIIAEEQTIPQTSITMPAINMSDAAPRKLGTAETITMGDVSFDSKTVKISKVGRGIKVPYEVIQYVAINLVSVFLQDFGVKLAMGIDNLAMNTLLNGDQAGGADSIAVVGTATGSSLTFKDILKVWVRMGRLGKVPTVMIGGEDISVDILDLLATSRVEGVQRLNINIKTPMPQSASHYVHGAIPSNQVIILDPSAALVKLNAQPLLVESEKIISNQTEQTFATITTGFATVYRDSRIILDKSKAFGSFGFPTWMDPTSQELVTFD